MNERKPADVAEEIAALLAQSEKDEFIDTGEAVRLLEDARDTLRAVRKPAPGVLLEALTDIHKLWLCPAPKTLRGWAARCDVMADYARKAIAKAREA